MPRELPDRTGPALLSLEQVQEASRVIAAAFGDDPVWIYILPDPGRRCRSLTWLSSVGLRLALPYGATYATPGERVEGVAVFYPPGRYPVSLLRQAWLVRAMPLRFPPGAIVRALRSMAITERARPKEPKHWYLHTLAVAPERQRQGIGSFLMAPVLERADEEGLAVYLETTNEANLAYYKRFDFEVEKELSLPGGGPLMWTMLRGAPPRGP